MQNWMFVSLLCASAAVAVVLAHHHLPRERWQVLASVPTRKCASSGRWSATNLTFYGALTAAAGVVSIALLVVLLRSIAVTWHGIAGLVVVVLAVALPSSTLVAARVEKKPHTLSIAGAVFPTLVLVPAVLTVVARALPGVLGSAGPTAVLAALAVVYVIGEGLGRIACLSFGCCYGRPVDSVPAWLQPAFARWHVVFHGRTKKIAYAGGLEGVKVVPIQEMTSWVHLFGGGLALWAFLCGDFRLALLGGTATALGWRFASEFLRNDHRGRGGWISAYQKMALVGLAYCGALVASMGGTSGIRPDLVAGIEELWQPGVILALQAAGVLLFVHSGLSKVTGCSMDIHVHADRV